MNKLILYPATVILSLILWAFIGSTAKADQIFLFSDDLYAQSDIDRSQTSAKFSGGRFYTADDSVSSIVASGVVANPTKVIISARLDVSAFMPSNARIIYYLSNDAGFKWTQVNPGFTYAFDSAGNELKWKAVITRESPLVASAYIDNINLTYMVSDSITPSPFLNSVNSVNNRRTADAVLYGGGGDLNSFVCDALSSLGLGCGASHKVDIQQIPILSPSEQQNRGSAISQSRPKVEREIGTDTTGSLQASIANITIKRSVSDDEVILIKVSILALLKSKEKLRPTLGLNTDDAIFEIIKGQRHFIPTMDIFYDYGFDLKAVQSATQNDLERFPRAKLAKVYKDKKSNYYLTEGYMIRLIPNERVFQSYGDRKEDMITISKKEFNFYPRNQFVFLENPLTADVFQIVDNGTKRYIVPQVTQRLKINPEQIAPINKIQLDSYQNSIPVIF